MDARELPLSRRQGFSKTALAAALSEAGILYEHARPLGNPKVLRDRYRSGKQREGERGYRDHLRNGAAEAVDALAARLTELSTCLRCVEADHRACHRFVLVEELQFRLLGLAVEHL